MYKYDRSVPGVVISHREPGMGERLAGFFKIRTGTSTFSGHPLFIPTVSYNVMNREYRCEMPNIYRSYTGLDIGRTVIVNYNSKNPADCFVKPMSIF